MEITRDNLLKLVRSGLESLAPRLDGVKAAALRAFMKGVAATPLPSAAST